MQHIIETRRAGGQRRVSEYVLADSSLDTVPAANLQAAFVARRFVVSDALARLVAEMAFDKGRLR